MDSRADISNPAQGNPTLRDAIQADLTRLRAMQMRFAERLDKAAETEERPERLAQLNSAAVKTARAVRQIAVLQLEIAGERPMPNVRAPAAPANEDKPREPARPSNGPRPCPQPWEQGDYADYDDYTDQDRLLRTKAYINSRRRILVEAMNKDFRAAGREDICRQSPKTKFELILGIPHPELDKCIPEIEPELLFKWIGDRNLYLALGPGPPDAWAKYDEKERLYGGPYARQSA